MIFKTPAPKDIVRWYRKGVPGGGQKDRIFDRLKAKLTGGTDDSGTSYFSMLETKLSDKDADIIIKNMKTDIDGYPMFETGSTSGEDQRIYQEWIVERYLKTAGTEGFTDTSVAEEVEKEEEVEEEAEEIVEEAEEEVKENIEEAVEVVDEAIEEADVSEETGDISDITDILPQSFIDAVNQQQGTDYQKEKKSTGISNTKILSTLVGSLQKIQGQLGSIDNELKKQNALIGAALGTTVSNLNQIETSHDGLNDRFDGILEAFEAQTALKKKELDDAETDAAIDEQDDILDAAGTKDIKGFDPRKMGSPGYITGWIKKALGKLWKKFAPKKIRAIVRLFKNKLGKFAPKKLVRSITKKALGISADAGRRGAQRIVTRSALQIGGKKLAQAGAVKATQAFVKKAALGLMRPIIKRIPIFGGLIDFAVSLMLGEPVGRAAAKAVGAALGGFLGTFIPIPFAGTIVGGLLGDMVGGFLYDALTGGGGSEPKEGEAEQAETPQQKETGGLTKPGLAVMHGTEAIIPVDRYESGTKNQDMAGNVLSPVGGALIGASANFLTQAGPAASLVAPMFKQSANALTKFFDVPATLAQTNVGGAFSGIDTTMKNVKKKSEEDTEDTEDIGEFATNGKSAGKKENAFEKMKKALTKFFSGKNRTNQNTTNTNNGRPETEYNVTGANKITAAEFGSRGFQVQDNLGSGATAFGHTGRDVSMPQGTPLSLVAPGTVVEASTGHNGGYGNFVVIKLDDGRYVKSNHHSKNLVKAGDRVGMQSDGSVKAYAEVGSTGLSTGPHMHLDLGTGYNPGPAAVTGLMNPDNFILKGGVVKGGSKITASVASAAPSSPAPDAPDAPAPVVAPIKEKSAAELNADYYKPTPKPKITPPKASSSPAALMQEDPGNKKKPQVVVVSTTPQASMPMPIDGGSPAVSKVDHGSPSKTLLMQKLYK